MIEKTFELTWDIWAPVASLYNVVSTSPFPRSRRDARRLRESLDESAVEKRKDRGENGASRHASFSARRISPALRNREVAPLADRAAFRANSLIRRAGEKKRGKRSRAWGSGGAKAYSGCSCPGAWRGKGGGFRWSEMTRGGLYLWRRRTKVKKRKK